MTLVTVIGSGKDSMKSSGRDSYTGLIVETCSASLLQLPCNHKGNRDNTVDAEGGMGSEKDLDQAVPEAISLYFSIHEPINFLFA